ncbi:pantetheinase-like [Dermacentor andersoni]|uniref:pantetheinase-like n=1 Tax=Dermacentor andersoni TaxID=34620 RepID=UPI0021555EE6|nr:pantetheinase-like [Dermacentor andersoni]
MHCLWPLFTAALCCSAAYAFKAAVYEHVQDVSSKERAEAVAVNLAAYRLATANASRENADIIVFPEDGILYRFKNREEVGKWAEDIPKAGVVPCGSEETPLLANLSCLAKDHKMYLVANIVDKKPCNESEHDCPRDKVKYFNTNVAFDRNGTLVSRYHKNHLFVEPFMNPADPYEFAVFDTDFGARVGMFICFDILFAESSLLVEKHNVTLGVMSSWWFDELPAWYSVAVQQAWSLHNGIPLLASGIQRLEMGSLGSGIYGGFRGPLNYTYSPDGKSKLLLADLSNTTSQDPRYPGDVLHPEKRFLKYADVSDHAAQEITQPRGDSRVCLGDFCCSLSYETAELRDTFVLLAKHGRQNIANYMEFGIQQCFLAVCESANGTVCKSFKTKSATKFNKLQLTGAFATNAIFPVLASNELALTPKDKWQFEITAANVSSLTLKENGKDEDILQVALYARLYELDRFIH